MKDYSTYIYSSGTHYISNNGHDENGAYSGGKAGDQTGTEWYLTSWYSRPWECVLRYPDENVALLIAELGCAAALNDHIGYDQNQRDTYWTYLQKANYNPENITTDCESDCSSGVIANVKAAGYLMGISALQNITATYTGNMRSAFKTAGFEVLTADKYLSGSTYLKPGDILLNDSHHTCTNVSKGSKASFSPTSDTTSSGTTGSTDDKSATSKADAETIWNYLIGRIGNAYGVAGLMGNLYAESALIPINLQDSFEKSLGYTDTTYTNAVDNGTYTKFSSDSAGYGLAQWTYSTRKKALKSYCDSDGASIGNLNAQLGYLWKELQEDFSSLLKTLQSATSVKSASDAVLTKFEMPADQSSSVKTKRAEYGQNYYDKYANSQTTTATKTIDEIAEEVIAGKWGNGDTRKTALEAAGYDYATVQARVNELMSGSSTSSKLPTYTVNKTYTLQVDALRVRSGAGTTKSVKTYSQLTSNAKANAYSNGCLKKGTKVTCLKTKTVNSTEVWMEIPSGWVAAYYNNSYYIK